MISYFKLCLLFIAVLSSLELRASDVISLNGQWELSFFKQPINPVNSPSELRDLEKRGVEVQHIKATVPGNVELDMLKSGLIDNPMKGSNVYELRKYEGYQWSYSRYFKTPKIKRRQRVQLFFKGIDCFAEIWVNGKHVGSVANALIEHKFDITSLLNEKAPNKLQVIIRSAVMETQSKLLGIFSIGNFASEESIYARKAPSSYGWDIMPRVVSAGLWRDVELRVINPVHIKDVNWIIADIDTAQKTARIYSDIQLKLPFEVFGHLQAKYIIKRNGEIVYEKTEPVLSFAHRKVIELQNVDFWWPRGYGKPALYDVKVELIGKNGKIWDSDEKNIGIRTIKLDLQDVNLPNKPGRFKFVINGVPIFIRGTNWVPLDAFHSRDDSLLHGVFDMAVDLNCNMIRCWGGNVYPSSRFYDLCDENGIMVWQDFAMGCTFYPQRESFRKAIRQEVQSVVLKFRNHPSLVLWSGNNEDDESLRWTLMPFNINPNKDVISRNVIPNVLYEFDPTRPYLPSSPYFSQKVWENGGNEKLLPENHLWGPRGYYKAPFYKNASSVFVSEIGYHGCPNKESLDKMMDSNYVYPWDNNFKWNDEWLTKSVRILPKSKKTMGRNDLMINQVKLLFGTCPKNLDSFIFASQSVQAEAMKYFIELWRGNKFDNKTGIIWWNLRDGWPIVSDAITDYYNSKKLAYYFIKNSQRNVIVLINDPKEGEYPLIVSNDTRRKVEGSVVVTDVASGRKLFGGHFSVSKNSKHKITAFPKMPGQGILLIRYNINGNRYTNHYLYGKPPFDLKEYERLLGKTKIYNLNKYNL